MAWFEEVRSKGNVTAVRVVWRYEDGSKGKSRAFKVDPRKYAAAKRAGRKLPIPEDARVEHARVTVKKADGDTPDPRARRVTLEQVFEEYLNRATDKGELLLGPRTRSNYQHIWNKYVGPRLGSLPLVAIKRKHVRDLKQGITSERQRVLAVSLVRALLYYAMDDELIKANPAARMRLGEQRKNEPEVATREELHALADAVKARYRALIYVTAVGGLRPSEAFAIPATNVDWLRRRIRIDVRSVEVPGAGLHVGKTKTKAATRWVTLPEWVMTELSRHVEQHPPGAEGLLFTNEHGERLRQSSFRTRVWQPGLKRARVTRPLTFQNLRHTGASLVHEAGFSERDVADRLGHTSTRMAARYIRTYEDRGRKIADALGALEQRPAEGSGA